MKRTTSAIVLVALGLAPVLHADENFFGWARNSETLPQGKWDMYHTVTSRGSVDRGTYQATDYEVEIEHGITDAFQISMALEGSHFKFGNNDFSQGLHTGYGETQEGAVFRGGSVAGKYNILSPFKDDIGVALRGAMGYTAFDEVAGVEQNEFSYTADLILQKNFLDNTLITVANLVFRQTTGKQPAEEYDSELACHVRGGASYRLMDNWYAGLESRFIYEAPHVVTPTSQTYRHEHHVLYAGPVIHYGVEKYWVTLSAQCQVYGTGQDEPVKNRTYAEEQKLQVRLKIGVNF